MPFIKGHTAWNKGIKTGQEMSEAGRKKISELRKIPTKRECTICGNNFLGGSAAKYCRTPCKPKKMRMKRPYIKRPKQSVYISGRRWREKLRKEVFTHYAGDPPICKCCGEDKKEFLVIDHIKGKGAQHRKKYKITSGAGLHSWLRKNSYPKGFRVLCDNCNMSLGRYGYCPHQK